MKYKRKVPCYSLKIFAYCSLCFMMATLLSFLIFQTFHMLTYLLFMFSLLFVFFHTCDVLDFERTYSYSNEYITLSCLKLNYKKIYYKDYNAVYISNAYYIASLFYREFYYKRPMCYKSKGNDGTVKTIYPFITLHTPMYPYKCIQKEMTSNDLYSYNSEQCIFLGICWFDSLKEMLHYTDLPVYVLEDVYLRFKGMFDMIFKDPSNSTKRFYIVTDKNIEYEKYLEGER